MFSVIIPLYNKEAYIQKAIQSVLKQTFTEFELLIVDNDSNDHSLHLAAQFTDPRITLLSESVKGVSSTRNKGIEAAVYDYICFLDADDYWLENHLEILNNLIKQFPQAGLYANAYQIIDANGKMRHAAYSQYSAGNAVMLNNYFKDIAWGDSPIHIDAACVPKSVLWACGNFHPNIHYGEDSLLWSKIFLNHKIVISNTATAVYVRAADNRSDLPEKLCAEFPFVAELEKLLAWPAAEKYSLDIRSFIAKQLFLNLISCLRCGKMKEARNFAIDPRLQYFPHALKLNFVKTLCRLPSWAVSLILKLLYGLNLIK